MSVVSCHSVCVHMHVRLWQKLWVLAFWTGKTLLKALFGTASWSTEGQEPSVSLCLFLLISLGFHSLCRFELECSVHTEMAACYCIMAFWITVPFGK